MSTTRKGTVYSAPGQHFLEVPPVERKKGESTTTSIERNLFPSHTDEGSDEFDYEGDESMPSTVIDTKKIDDAEVDRAPKITLTEAQRQRIERNREAALEKRRSLLAAEIPSSVKSTRQIVTERLMASVSSSKAKTQLQQPPPVSFPFVLSRSTVNTLGDCDEGIQIDFTSPVLSSDEPLISMFDGGDNGSELEATSPAQLHQHHASMSSSSSKLTKEQQDRLNKNRQEALLKRAQWI